MAQYSSTVQLDGLRPVVESPSERPEVTEAVTAMVNKTAAAPSWDPYEVWLTRVKQPRDRRALDQNSVI
jgi:hypothetical protein